MPSEKEILKTQKDTSSEQNNSASKNNDTSDSITDTSLSEEISSLKEELKQQAETNKQENENIINEKNKELNKKEETISSLEKNKETLDSENQSLQEEKENLQSTINTLKKEKSEQKMQATEISENKENQPTDSSGSIVMLVGGTILFCGILAMIIYFIKKQWNKYHNNTPIDKETFIDKLHKIPYIAVNDLDYQIEIFGIYNEIKEKTNDDNFDFQTTVLLTGKRVIASIQKNGEFYCDNQYDDVYHLCERYSKYLKKQNKKYKPKH